jgi:hypothetical protein
VAWAFVAHKDGYWAGVCSPKVGKAELRKFLGDFAAAGFSITSVDNREEYVNLIGGMGCWHQRPAVAANAQGSLL